MIQIRLTVCVCRAYLCAQEVKIDTLSCRVAYALALLPEKQVRAGRRGAAAWGRHGLAHCRVAASVVLRSLGLVSS
jgi:hypothetical protein